VEYELNGYPSKDNLPEYRVLQVQSYGHFSGPFGSGLRNAPIPPSTIPKQFRQFVTTAYITQPVSDLTQLVESKKEGNLQLPWPADLIALVGMKIYADMYCLGAWQLIPRGSIVAILDTVRNRILSFVLEIEAEVPDVGEAPPNTHPIAQERVTQIFNTYISGNVSNLATGSHTFTQKTMGEIRQGDHTALRASLADLGISTSDIDELERDLEQDAKKRPAKSIGEHTGGWIGKMITKASSGALNISTSVAGDILTKMISQYL